MIYRISFSSPIGDLTLEEEDGKITSILFFHLPSTTTTPLLEKTRKELIEYFNGERQQFDIPLKTNGTSFQEKVWNVIKGIPFGETISYKEIGERIGSKAYRAIGSACGKNPIPIIIPCHRVLGKDNFGGFSGGIEKKKVLLKLEGASV